MANAIVGERSISHTSPQQLFHLVLQGTSPQLERFTMDHGIHNAMFFKKESEICGGAVGRLARKLGQGAAVGQRNDIEPPVLLQLLDPLEIGPSVDHLVQIHRSGGQRQCHDQADQQCGMTAIHQKLIVPSLRLLWQNQLPHGRSEQE